MFPCPNELSTPWSFLYVNHRSMPVFCMKVPLTIKVVNLNQNDPESFKARTYGNVVEFASWFLDENPDYKFQAFVLTHEFLHQMFCHQHTLWTWQSEGSISGRLKDHTMVTRPYDEMAAQHSLDYQVNDAAAEMGLPTAGVKLWDPRNIGTWLDDARDLYVRVFDKYYPPALQAPPPPPQQGKPQPGQDDSAGKPNGDPSDTGDPSTIASSSRDSGASPSNEDVGQGKPQSGKPTPGPQHPSNNPDLAGQIGAGASDVVPSDPESEPGDEVERRRIAIRKAFAPENTSRTIGSQPGDLERLIDKIYPVKINWWEIVRPRFLHHTFGNRKTWTPPDRTAWAKGYTLQSRVSPRAGFLVVGVDTSGSITRKEQEHFISHLQGLCDVAMPMRMIIIELDAIVHRVTHINEPHQLRKFLLPMETGQAGLIGGGGTDMRKLDAYLVEQNLRPDMSIIFTDGETPYPTTLGQSKECVWVLTRDHVVPPQAGSRARMWMN